MKRSALKAMNRNTPTRNRWLAMLGSPVAVPHGDRMAALACYCARVRKTQVPLPDKWQWKLYRAAQILNHRRERLAKRRVAPRLIALLWDSLADLNAERFDHFAAIIRRILEHDEAIAGGNNWQALPTAEKIFRIADVARTAGKPMTGREVLKRAGVDKQHDDASRERKALTLAGKWLAPEKRGRKKGTRNR